MLDRAAAGSLTAENEAFFIGLLAAASAGDQHAFAELYRLTAPRMNAIARRVAGDQDRASEALQEANVRIWCRAATFDRTKGSLFSWMITIVRNATIDLLRRHGRPIASIEESDDLMDVSRASPEAAIDIERCLGRLEGPQARAVPLAFLFGYSHSELSVQMAAPLGTVKSWVERGLRKLRSCLDGVE